MSLEVIKHSSCNEKSGKGKEPNHNELTLTQQTNPSGVWLGLRPKGLGLHLVKNM